MNNISIEKTKLLGDFIGTLEAVCLLDIPEPLIKRLQEKIEKLRSAERNLKESPLPGNPYF